MMRVLVLGGGGMLGHKLVQSFQKEFDTWTTLRAPIKAYEHYGIFDAEKTIDGVDLLDFGAIVKIILRVRPQVVINCVGIIKQLPEATDPILTLTINSLLPHKLQNLCRANDAKLIHISTDCVFRGDRGMYTEDDISDAADLYGRSKFLGETAGSGALTLRTSIVGREIGSRSGLVEWFLSNRGKHISGYAGATFSGLTTQALASVIGFVIRQHPNLIGTIQVSSNPISKYDLLHLLRQAYDLQVDIDRDDSVRIDRSLDSSKFRRLTGYVPPSWPEMVAEMADDPTPYERWRTQHGI